MSPRIKQLMMEAHDRIVDQDCEIQQLRHYIMKLELALSCAVPPLEEQPPTSEAGQAARLIRAAIDVKYLPLPRISRPTLIINNDMARVMNNEMVEL